MKNKNQQARAEIFIMAKIQEYKEEAKRWGNCLKNKQSENALTPDLAKIYINGKTQSIEWVETLEYILEKLGVEK